jgi:hypothetical protein
MLDWEERDGIAQYAIARASLEQRPWIDPLALAEALGVEVVRVAPRGYHGIALLEPPTIYVGRRALPKVVAHELSHITTAWCLPPGIAHDEVETDDIARQLAIPSGPLRCYVRRWGAAAIDWYPETLRWAAGPRVSEMLLELASEGDSAESVAIVA